MDTLNKISSFNLKPKMVQLYVPPIVWKGDPKGHVGVYDAFFYVVKGECYLLIENECVILKEGELAFLPKGKMRTYSAIPSSVTMYEIDFDAEIDGEHWYSKLNMSGEHYSVKVKDPEKFSRLFEQSLRHELDKDVFYDLLCSSNLSRIICEYLSLCGENEENQSPFKEVVRYMRENLSCQIKVEALAQIACMESTYFIKKFKSAFGSSPINYLNKLRIYRAMTLLASSNLSVDSICKTVGIYDNSYFSRTFKKYCSITPSEYREIFR
ncbi:MAG: AraC family transcriptional regulator [Ruminococcaceae bacterium]|nr:AraC family transcriptional regulator [Oscillospiraceae bacterium]